MTTRAELLSHLVRWKDLGIQNFPDDVYAMGGEPNVVPQNWQHLIFPSPPREIRGEFLDQFPMLKEFSYNETLAEFNGLKLFKSALFLYGFYFDAELTSGHMVWDIFTANRERLRNFGDPYDAIVIGGGQFDEIDRVYSQTRDGRILAIDYYSKAIVREWESFDVFLFGEIERLDSIVADDGTVLNLDAWADYNWDVALA